AGGCSTCPRQLHRHRTIGHRCSRSRGCLRPCRFRTGQQSSGGSVRARRLPWLIPLLSTLVFVRSLPAQAPDVEEPLESFVQEVVRLWEAADVQALVDLIAEEDQIILDT